MLRLSDNRFFLSNWSRPIKRALKVRASTQAYNVFSIFLKCLIQFKTRNGESGCVKDKVINRNVLALYSLILYDQFLLRRSIVVFP